MCRAPPTGPRPSDSPSIPSFGRRSLHTKVTFPIPSVKQFSTYTWLGGSMFHSSLAV
ncbi:hypothetical protein BC830DRAFT_1140944 [Chytriomyces sp. MP71]|nr:hypothetical protein BC830DRAFT_1140944 [Chytriomyces sp. MP71]